MARCALCQLVASRGVLCEAHGKAIAPRAFTAEQLVVTPAQAPAATLIDPWGNPIPIDAVTQIGRSRERGIALLHASISQHHATVRKHGESWTLTDEGSRNGTRVDETPITEVPLHEGARIQFGDLSMYFVSAVLPARPPVDGPGRTSPTRRDLIVFRAQLDMRSGPRIELSQRVEGGVLRAGEAAIELGKLEFRLLQVLTEARQTNADPDQAYVSWQQIASRLEFKSTEADSENVRELVRRVRRKLGAAAVPELLESKHGVGYRITGDPIEDVDA